MAGIWQSHVHNQLLWRQTHPIRRKSMMRSIPFWDLAPSWSWASIDAAVEWPLHVQDIESRLCTITIDENSSTLRVNGTLLNLTYENCLSIPGELGTITMTTPLQRSAGTIQFDFYPDSWFLHKVSVSAADSLEYLVHNTSALPIQLQSHPLLSSIECLILWKDSSLRRGAYRRVGFARMQGDVLNGPGSKTFVRDLLSGTTEVFAQNRGIHNQVHYDPSLQSGPHLIKIM